MCVLSIDLRGSDCPAGNEEIEDDSDSDSERIEEVVLMDDMDMETIKDY